MEEIKISIIIPCLNAKEYIEEALESVSNQTLREIEIIVVDAGSTDGTINIIKIYQKKDNRVRFIKSDKRSMGYQYNIGIQNARGQYVGFVESDDYIDTNMYEKMYQLAKEYQLDFIKSDFDMFINDGRNRLFLNYSVVSSGQDKLYGVILFPKEHPEILYRDVNMWNGIYDRNFLMNHAVILNETEGAAFQDLGFVIKSFVSASRIMYVKMKSYYYRKDNINASVYNHRKHIHFLMNEFQYAWKYMIQKHIEAPFRAIVFKRCFGLFCAYYDHIRFHELYDGSIQEQVEYYMKFFGKCFTEMKYSEIRAETLDSSLSLSLIDDSGAFESVRRYIDHLERTAKLNFYHALKGRLLVICGAGERGTAVYAFLKRNHIETMLCFCDYDKSEEDKKLMGKICISPEKMQIQFQDKLSEILFVVTDEFCHKKIKHQLLHMGIKEENIIQSLNIVPHTAFEIDMEEFENEERQT